MPDLKLVFRKPPRRAFLYSCGQAVFVAMILSLAFPALAVQTPEHLVGQEGLILADGSRDRVARKTSWQTPTRALKAWEEFRNMPQVADAFSQNPLAWRGLWDHDTAIPSRLFGAGIAFPGSVAEPMTAELAAREFLQANIALLAPGSSLEDFKLVSNHLGDGMRTLGFIQHNGNLEVLGGQVSFRFKNDRLFVIGSEAYPHVEVAHWDSVIAAPRAANIAKAWIAKETGSTVRSENVAGPFILPVLKNGASPVYHTVVRVTVHAQAPVGKWEVFLDALTGKTIAREQMLKFATAQIQVNSPERWPGSTRLDRPAEQMHVNIGGTTRYTSQNGEITFDDAESVTATLKSTGPYVRVSNTAGSNLSLEQSLVAGETFVWDRADNEHDDAQITAFHAATIAKNEAQIVAPNMAWLTDDALNVVVNMEEESCNAYSDGTDIHFYAGSSQCHNTARLSDVVMHEFGHSFHAHAIIWGAGDFDGALSEGASDYWSATISDDPGMGRGFFRSNSPLRHLNNRDRVWPDDVAGDTHQTGIIFGGAMWDLREELMATMGEAEGRAHADKLFFAAMQRAADIPSTYVEILAYDDEDGDLANGTPNFCAIADTFARHGLADSEVSGGISKPTMSDLKVSVLAPNAMCPGMAITNIRVKWKWEGSTREEGTALVAEGDMLTAAIPAAQPGLRLLYQVEAEQENGTRLVYPQNPAAPWYEYFYGDVIPLYCTDFETNADLAAWEDQLLEGEEQEGANDWMHGAPQSTPGSGDPTEAFSGDKVIGNDLGGGEFNGMYQADKRNVLISPSVNVQNYEHVRLQYRRWLNVENGFYDQATIYANDTPIWTNLDSGDTGDIHHADKEWRFHDLNVSNHLYRGGVQIKYEIKSDAGLEMGGWTLDDFCIVAYVAPAAEAPTDGEGEAGAGDNMDGNTDGAEGEGAGGCNSLGSDTSLWLLLLLVGAMSLYRRREWQL